MRMPCRTTVLPPWPVDVLEFNTSMEPDGGHCLRRKLFLSSFVPPPHREKERGVKGNGRDGVDCPPTTMADGLIYPQKMTVNRSTLSAAEQAKLHAAEIVYNAWYEWWCTLKERPLPLPLSASSWPPTPSACSWSSTLSTNKKYPSVGGEKEDEECSGGRGKSLHAIVVEEKQREEGKHQQLFLMEKGWLCEKCLRVYVGPSFAAAVMREIVIQSSSTNRKSDASSYTAQEPKKNDSASHKISTIVGNTVDSPERTSEAVVEGKVDENTIIESILPPLSSVLSLTHLSHFTNTSTTTSSNSSSTSPDQKTFLFPKSEGELSSDFPTLKVVCLRDIWTRTVCPHCHTPRPGAAHWAYEYILLPTVSGGGEGDALACFEGAAPKRCTSSRSSSASFPLQSPGPSTSWWWWICGKCFEYNIICGSSSTRTGEKNNTMNATADVLSLSPPPLPNDATVHEHLAAPCSSPDVSICRCCGADAQITPHFFPSPVSLVSSPSSPTCCTSPVFRWNEHEELKGSKKEETTKEEVRPNKGGVDTEQMMTSDTPSMRHSTMHGVDSPSSSAQALNELDLKPVNSILNIRNKLMKWRCGRCQEVSSLQSPYCRYCGTERYNIVIACPRCSATRCLSNTMIYGGALPGGPLHPSAPSAASPSSFPWFGPRSCFSPLAASFTCGRCDDILHGGDVVGWGRRRRKEESSEAVPGSGDSGGSETRRREGKESQEEDSSSSALPTLSSVVVHRKAGSGGEGWWCGCGFVNPPLVSGCLRCRLPRWLPPLQRRAVVTKYWDLEGCSHWWCEVCQTINPASVHVVALTKNFQHVKSRTQGLREVEENIGGTTANGVGNASPSIPHSMSSMVKTTRVQHGKAQCVCCGAPWHFDQLHEDIVSTVPSLKGGRRSASLTSVSIANPSPTHQTNENKCWWRCACHHVNRRFNNICACCDLPAHSTGITADVLSFWMKGDWLCEYCQRHNYKLRVVCSCGMRRPTVPSRGHDRID